MLAHAGEEFLIFLVPVLVYLAINAFRHRKRSGVSPEEDREGLCLYCDQPIDPGLDRCPRCGFQVRAAQR